MRKHGITIAAVIVLGIVTFGVGIGKRDLWAPDEPRFGQVAREMIQRGDPFVLHVNGEPYSDKPPLYMWMAVAFTYLQGGDGSQILSFATRLPSALGGLLGLVAVYGIALLLFGSRRIAFLSAVALCTMQMYQWQGANAQLDMLMTGWTLLAVWAYLLADRATTEGRRMAWWGLFWIAAGLGTLSKGPPALIVSLGTIAFYRMARRDPRRAWRTAIVWSVAILVLTIVARFGWLSGTPFLVFTGLAVLCLLVEVVWDWLIPLAREPEGRLGRRLGLFVLGLFVCLAVVGVWFVPYRMNAPREASNDTLVAQTVVRYLAGDNHANPPWYFVQILPYNIMPWTVFFFLALWVAWRSKRQPMAKDPRLFLTVWILFTFVFFSLSPGKRDQYILPCIPAFAIFVGWFFDQLFEAPELREGLGWRRAAWFNLAVSVVCAVVAIAFAVAKLAIGDTPPTRVLTYMQNHDMSGADWQIVQSIALWPVAILGVASAVGIWWETRRRRALRVFAVIALTFVGLNFYLHNEIFPKVDPRKSGRHLSEGIARYRTDEPVGIYDFFREDYIAYADYFLTVIDEMDKSRPVETTALWEFINPARGRVIVIFRDRTYRDLVEKYPLLKKNLHFLFETNVGHRGMVVADNLGDGER